MDEAEARISGADMAGTSGGKSLWAKGGDVRDDRHPGSYGPDHGDPGPECPPWKVRPAGLWRIGLYPPATAPHAQGSHDELPSRH